ncbi:DrmB family protein [Nonomuraea jabiensis]|uniref:DrmB family protein n=1 Tax=Nonomuraea jabiensis TaxID=882448 RepID=UPI00341DF7E7
MSKSYQVIRPSQFITTFGPGSVVETPSGPVVLKSMDALFTSLHRQPHEFEIIDERLSKGILDGARISRIPTNAEVGQATETWIYPTDGFPFWALCAQHPNYQILYQIGAGCPECGKMPDWQRRQKGGREAIRFVTACQAGHLDEVPWQSLVHAQSKPCGTRHYRWYGGGRALRLVRIECPKCKASVNFGTAYGRQWKCSGRRPEHGGRPDQSTCSQPASIVQRGSANLRIAELVTALTILDMRVRLHDVLGSRELLARIDVLLEGDLLTHDTLLAQAKKCGISPDDIEHLARTPWPDIRSAVDQLLDVQPTGPNAVRDAELDRLRDAATNGAPVGEHSTGPASPPLFEVKQVDVRSVTGPNGRMTFRVTPVSRLRMVMVQTGYRRLNPETGHIIPTSFLDRGITWYPGVELFGEGIFIDLGDAPLVVEGQRVLPWQRLHMSGDPMDLTNHPTHVWWHSLSHRLLWALSVDSGYSSAAIRERVYVRVEDNNVINSGLLLYTVQPGGDGTMGGLISLVNRFERVLERALRDVDTCSNDPLCDEAPGSGADGAACYSCLFVSETSCEHRNHGLDRLLLTENLP